MRYTELRQKNYPKILSATCVASENYTVRKIKAYKKAANIAIVKKLSLQALGQMPVCFA